MFSNTGMQLSIKIPEDSIKMAALKAIKIMREVRDAYLEEGNHQFAAELVTPKSIKSSPTNCSPVFEPPQKPKKEFKRNLSWKDNISETANLCEIRNISPRNQPQSPKELSFINEPPKDSIDAQFVEGFQALNIFSEKITSVIKSLSPKAKEHFEI